MSMKKLAVFAFCFFALIGARAQGCSDAGFCTIPSIAPFGKDTSNFSAEMRFSLEASEPGALIISPQVWLHYSVSETVNLDLKLAGWIVNDDSIGSLTSASDPILSATFKVYEKEDLKLFITSGFRLGINNANSRGSYDDLPMDYQSSLGTTDLILGLNATRKDLSGSLALQYPIWQYNKNQNVVAKYAHFDGLDTVLLEYKRKPDIMLRLEKKWQLDDWGFRFGIMPIIHLGNDYLKSTSVNATVAIDNSAGLTLNIPMGMWYTTHNWTFGLDIGFPIVTRQERPDGLTRKYVVQPRIVYSFSKKYSELF